MVTAQAPAALSAAHNAALQPAHPLCCQVPGEAAAICSLAASRAAAAVAATAAVLLLRAIVRCRCLQQRQHTLHNRRIAALRCKVQQCAAVAAAACRVDDGSGDRGVQRLAASRLAASCLAVIQPQLRKAVAPQSLAAAVGRQVQQAAAVLICLQQLLLAPVVLQLCAADHDDVSMLL